MNILITGGRGFLGSHLATELEAAGHITHSVDIHEADLRDEGETLALITGYRPQVVVHFAAQVGRQFCEDDPAHAIRSNVDATLHVAKACEYVGAQLVHTSTSEVYGEHGDAVCDEQAPLVGRPTGMYALTKRWSEDVAVEYGPEVVKILRPSMPYGPGAPPGRGRRALDNFLWQAHHRMPLTVHRDATRSWCWIGDATRAIRTVIESDETGPFNIGRDDAEVSMLKVAQMACAIAGAPPSLITEIDPPERQTVVKRLSTARLRSLGWEPKVDLRTGMGEVYKWVQNFDEDGNHVD